jgi:hypothetical protein
MNNVKSLVSSFVLVSSMLVACADNGSTEEQSTSVAGAGGSGGSHAMGQGGSAGASTAGSSGSGGSGFSCDDLVGKACAAGDTCDGDAFQCACNGKWAPKSLVGSITCEEPASCTPNPCKAGYDCSVNDGHVMCTSSAGQGGASGSSSAGAGGSGNTGNTGGSSGSGNTGNAGGSGPGPVPSTVRYAFSLTLKDLSSPHIEVKQGPVSSYTPPDGQVDNPDDNTVWEGPYKTYISTCNQVSEAANLTTFFCEGDLPKGKWDHTFFVQKPGTDEYVYPCQKYEDDLQYVQDLWISVDGAKTVYVKDGVMQDAPRVSQYSDAWPLTTLCAL